MNFFLLKHKNFFLLIIASFVSLIGTQMLEFALSLYVLKTTGSATKFASVLAISLIPMLILGPIGGVLVDWFNRKKIIIILDLLSGIVILYYSFQLNLNGALTINQIYFCTIFLSTISSIYNPAISTVIPSIVDKENLIDANGISTIFKNTANFLGPILAGMLFGFGGLLPILILDSISFFIASLSEFFIDIPINKVFGKINFDKFVEDFKEGLNFIRSKKLLLVIIIMGLVVNFVYSPILSIGCNYIAKINFNISDYQLGILNSVAVLSAFLAPFLCKVVSKKIKLGKILFLDIFIVSILMSILAVISTKGYMSLFTNNFIPYVSLIIIEFSITLISSIGNLALGTIVQKETPLSYMGRISAVFSTVLMAAAPIGQMIFGIMFDSLSSFLCIIISAIILFITINLFRKPLLNGEN